MISAAAPFACSVPATVVPTFTMELALASLDEPPPTTPLPEALAMACAALAMLPGFGVTLNIDVTSIRSPAFALAAG